MSEASAQKAFDVLREFEKRALIHAVGLPEQAGTEGIWTGIAYRLAGANLVSAVGQIAEIMNVPGYTRVPGARGWMLGVANVRGNLVPIVDLRAFLSGERTALAPSTRLLVVPQQGGNVGLIIDEVVGQRHFLDEEASAEAHYAEHMVAPYVAREYLKDDEAWAVFEVGRLVTNQDFQQAAA